MINIMMKKGIFIGGLLGLLLTTGLVANAAEAVFNDGPVGFNDLNPGLESLSGGDGLLEIRSIDDLLGINSQLDGHYKLMADINLTDVGNWQPLGDSAIPFSGEFVGNGYTISGLTSQGHVSGGLFGYISGAIISNIFIEVNDISSLLYAGALVGNAYHSNITDVHVNSLSGASIYAGEHAGLLVGYQDGGGLLGSSAEFVEAATVIPQLLVGYYNNNTADLSN